jgi:hypothetical protein
VEILITNGGDMKEYTDTILREGVKIRKFKRENLMSESTWHRDQNDRLVEVIQGKNWKIQVDNRLPIIMKEGDVYKIPAGMWHRIIPANNDLTILIKEEVSSPMDIAGIDIADVIDDLGEDFGGPLSPGVPASMTQDLQLESKKKSNHMPGYKAPEGSSRDKKLDAASSAYKRGDVASAIRIRDEMEKQAREKPGFKSRKSKYTDESKQPADYPPVMSEFDEESYNEDDMCEGLSGKTRETLKKKAKNSNAPLGALATVYRKGLGAFYSSGSRPGVTSHQWAMARVNSFLSGGKARQVDSAQWKAVQKFRKKN